MSETTITAVEDIVQQLNECELERVGAYWLPDMDEMATVIRERDKEVSMRCATLIEQHGSLDAGDCIRREFGLPPRERKNHA